MTCPRHLCRPRDRSPRLATLGLLTLLIAAGACGGGDAPGGEAEEAAPGMPQRMEAEAPSTTAPMEESIALTVDGETPDLTQMVTCVATPGLGLGTQWSTADHVGDGSQGLGIAAGFERDQGRVTITFRNQRWQADAGTGELNFQMSDARTDDGHSFVTVEASGRVAADGQELPFELTVTCEPGGR